VSVEGSQRAAHANDVFSVISFLEKPDVFCTKKYVHIIFPLFLGFLAKLGCVLQENF